MDGGGADDGGVVAEGQTVVKLSALYFDEDGAERLIETGTLKKASVRIGKGRGAGIVLPYCLRDCMRACVCVCSSVMIGA